MFYLICEQDVAMQIIISLPPPQREWGTIKMAINSLFCSVGSQGLAEE